MSASVIQEWLRICSDHQEHFSHSEMTPNRYEPSGWGPDIGFWATVRRASIIQEWLRISRKHQERFRHSGVTPYRSEPSVWVLDVGFLTHFRDHRKRYGAQLNFFIESNRPIQYCFKWKKFCCFLSIFSSWMTKVYCLLSGKHRRWCLLLDTGGEPDYLALLTRSLIYLVLYSGFLRAFWGWE